MRGEDGHEEATCVRENELVCAAPLKTRLSIGLNAVRDLNETGVLLSFLPEDACEGSRLAHRAAE